MEALYSLQLLMRYGAARVRFHPRLTAEQYAELLQRIEGPFTEIRDAEASAARKLQTDAEAKRQRDRRNHDGGRAFAIALWLVHGGASLCRLLGDVA